MIYTERLIELARRKERLIASADQQRAALEDEFRVWRKPIGLLDRGIAAAVFLRAHPALTAAAIAAAAVLGRRNLLRWVGRGLVVWRSWRALRGWVRKFDA